MEDWNCRTNFLKLSTSNEGEWPATCSSHHLDCGTEELVILTTNCKCLQSHALPCDFNK
jgi:hypothetical protein